MCFSLRLSALLDTLGAGSGLLLGRSGLFLGWSGLLLGLVWFTSWGVVLYFLGCSGFLLGVGLFELEFRLKTNENRHEIH